MADNNKNKGPVKKKKVSDEFQEDDIFQAPEIVREPSSRQAKLGSNVVLRITATGKPLPSFQWFHNGKKISGANSDRLTLSKVRRASAGAYHCEARNHAGKAVSRQCMLSFFTQKVPKLVLDHRELSIPEGKPISLKVVCNDPAAFKDFRVFWVFNGMRIKGAYGLELNIAAGKKKYEGEYKAMISVGSGIETSNVCKITITAAKSATAPAAADDAQVDGTMVGTLSPSPADLILSEPEVKPAPEPVSAEDWTDSLFNPDDEDAGPVASVEEGTREFDSREIRMNAKEAEAALANAQPSPLDLIASMKKETIEEKEEPVVATAEPEPEPLPFLPDREEDEDSKLIADWDSIAPLKAKAQAVVEEPVAQQPVAQPRATVMPIMEKPRARAPSPKLAKKKEFLENMLTRWQKRMARQSSNAA